MLKPDGKRDLYGLCTPTKEGADTFDYGIGMLIDEDTEEFVRRNLKRLVSVFGM